MEFVQQNINWNAEPNAPMPKVEIKEGSSKIVLTFYMNAFMYENVDEDDIGVIEFDNCLKFRIGSTNDEGFYRGQCRFAQTGVEWGEFYRIVNSNWKEYFPSDEVAVDANLEHSTELNHYLFYFRDETFECIAESYSFKIKSASV